MMPAEDYIPPGVSELPWNVFEENARCPGIEASPRSGLSVVIYDDEDGDIGVQGETQGEAKANASYIVHAANAYPRLCEALMRVSRCVLIHKEDPDIYAITGNLGEAIKAARALLSECRKEAGR